jgi:hypothetical protein
MIIVKNKMLRDTRLVPGGIPAPLYNTVVFQLNTSASVIYWGEYSITVDSDMVAKSLAFGRQNIRKSCPANDGKSETAL